jgi:hypothetical protein
MEGGATVTGRVGRIAVETPVRQDCHRRERMSKKRIAGAFAATLLTLAAVDPMVAEAQQSHSPVSPERGTEGPAIRQGKSQGAEGPDVRKQKKKKTSSARVPKPKITEGPDIRKEQKTP